MPAAALAQGRIARITKTDRVWHYSSHHPWADPVKPDSSLTVDQWLRTFVQLEGTWGRIICWETWKLWYWDHYEDAALLALAGACTSFDRALTKQREFHRTRQIRLRWIRRAVRRARRKRAAYWSARRAKVCARAARARRKAAHYWSKKAAHGLSFPEGIGGEVSLAGGGELALG